MCVCSYVYTVCVYNLVYVFTYIICILTSPDSVCELHYLKAHNSNDCYMCIFCLGLGLRNVQYHSAFVCIPQYSSVIFCILLYSVGVSRETDYVERRAVVT